MAEYIDREAFKKSVEEHYCLPCKGAGKDYNGCKCRACWVDDMLDEVDCFQPAADVAPVVRCKDCKHEFGGSCIICGFQKRKPEDFCSCGERKEGKRR